MACRNTLTGVGAGTLAVGGATALVGLIWALTSSGSSASDDASLHLRPVASPDAAGFSASGRF